VSAFSFARKSLQFLAAKYNLQIERKYEFGEFRLDVLELSLLSRAIRKIRIFSLSRLVPTMAKPTTLSTR
jgi:hypothetical protein